MQKWEYYHLSSDFNPTTKIWLWNDGKTGTQADRLEEFGRNGWELVSVAVYPDPTYPSIMLYFKRPIE
ncbi:MAG TPA: hypothetical protein VK206_15925 [Anaerolineales bacterium]|nr:hypothetical protein [Anaerolineales bacterium]